MTASTTKQFKIQPEYNTMQTSAVQCMGMAACIKPIQPEQNANHNIT